MEDRVFSFSEKEIKKRGKNIYLIMALMPIVMIATIYVLNRNRGGEVDYTPLIIIFLGISVFVEVEMLIVSKLMFSKLRKLKLVLNDGGFIRTANNREEKVSYNEINKIDVKYNVDGSICFIKIKYKNKIISINGFENLDEILDTLKKNLLESVEVKEKRYRINWNNPIILIVWMAIVTVVILAIMGIGRGAYAIFNFVFMLDIALAALFFKPISKSAGVRFRKWEVIFGIVMIILDILSVVS